MADRGAIIVETIEMHTGGEPLRIITSGYPTLEGNTILDKRRYLKSNLDNLRKFLMFEPRGHYDQYGALLVEADHPEAHLAVIFMHNEGYSTMCGHAIIALGRFAVDYGYIKCDSNQTHCFVNIQCPCGLVKTEVAMENGQTGAVKFISVPSFAYKTDVKVETKEYGTVQLDIGYGGAFYALVADHKLDMSVTGSSVRDLVDAAHCITTAVKEQVNICHPEEDDLSFLYGTIITDGKDEFSSETTSNLCVFADKQVDRSPTGSGVTARIAVQYAKKLIELNQERIFENGAVHSKFTGKAVEETRCGEFAAVCVQVSGKAYYSGKAMFTYEQEDPLKNGFLIR